MWIYLYINIAVFIGFFIFGFIHRRLSGVCKSTKRLNGKTIIVTGASSGIGKEAAKDFAERGARVILACIDLKNAEKVKDRMIAATGNRKVVVRHLDLSDLDSVRKFATETLKKEDRLDVLVNNAGAAFIQRLESKNGSELTLATNYLGHFLLTNLLLGLLKKSAPSRVINVSSMAYKLNNMDLADLHFKRRKYTALKAYTQSKRCILLFTRELAQLVKGQGITVNSLHPGVVGTKFLDRDTTLKMRMFSTFISVVGKTSKQGAQTTIYLAVSDEVANVTGKYFADCKLEELWSSVKDQGLSKKLWEISEKEVGLKKEEMHNIR